MRYFSFLSVFQTIHSKKERIQASHAPINSSNLAKQAGINTENGGQRSANTPEKRPWIIEEDVFGRAKPMSLVSHADVTKLVRITHAADHPAISESLLHSKTGEFELPNPALHENPTMTQNRFRAKRSTDCCNSTLNASDYVWYNCVDK